jgi:hypothetical protein
MPSYKDVKVSVEGLGEFALPHGLNPIPVKVHPKSTDTLFFKGMDKICLHAENTVSAASKAAFLTNEKDLDRFAPTIVASKWNQYLKNIPGATKWDTKNIGILSDIYKCSEYYDDKPMEGLESIKDWMKYIFGVFYYYENFPDAKVTKLQTTNISKMILQKMEL